MARPTGAYTRIQWDQDELEKIKTISMKTGIKATTEIMRLALTHEYAAVTGSFGSKDAK